MHLICIHLKITSAYGGSGAANGGSEGNNLLPSEPRLANKKSPIPDLQWISCADVHTFLRKQKTVRIY